jgi:nucleoside-diphosphate-sugar epimerase
MKVFVTGGHGYIGTTVTQQLLAAGHSVLGLAHHDSAASQLVALGAQVFRGTLSDPKGLIPAVEQSDAVIALAFNHNIGTDMSIFQQSVADAAAAIREMGTALGDDKVMILATGFPWPGDDQGVRREELEQDLDASKALFPRVAADIEIWKLAKQGRKVGIVRLPTTVHAPHGADSGMIPNIITASKRAGSVGYVGEGANRWAAVHRSDAARLFVSAIDKLKDGSLDTGRSLHAVGDRGITTKEIAETIAKGLGIKAESMTAEESGKRGGFLVGMAWGLDIAVSNEKTKEWTGWEPKECGLLADIVNGGYLTGPEHDKFLPK